jgi:hypothetical protein
MAALRLPQADGVDRSRLTVDSLKWYQCKLAPKKYGDKVAAELSAPTFNESRGHPCRFSTLGLPSSKFQFITTPFLSLTST